MGRTKADKPGATGTGAQEEVTLGERRGSQDALLVATLAEHTQKFKDRLNAVLDIKTTLESEIDALRINIGYLCKDQKKLKDRVKATKNTVPDMRPTVADTATHINDLKKRYCNYDSG
ncbi:hypothetical protein NDU88_004911 [Pleurodeles waltl]|uniref:Uncharacterized protein n=1 Tax=Pleurodeles waltl TaxID=8319 RepID=A0AAV7QJP7_PLEWA|nr:hypothetical protein NDU88_004911 [Pleurodeles waltl]